MLLHEQLGLNIHKEEQDKIIRAIQLKNKSQALISIQTLKCSIDLPKIINAISMSKLN